MLDAVEILTLAKDGRADKGIEFKKYVTTGSVLLEIANLILKSKYFLIIDNKKSLRIYSEYIQSIVHDYIHTRSQGDELDVRWLDMLTTNCSARSITDCTELQKSENRVFKCNLDIYEATKHTAALRRLEPITKLRIRFNAVKEFALKSSELLLEKVQNSNSNQFLGDDSFHKAILPHIPSIFIAEGLLSVNPKIDFKSTYAIEIYMSQIRSLFCSAKSWADAYGDITFELLEECINTTEMALKTYVTAKK